MKRAPALFAVVTAALAGCADSGPALVPVHGKVTLDGKALAFKSVRFIPEPGTPGAGAGANTTGDGSYTLIAVRPGATRDVMGVPAGAYRVVVTEPMFPIEARPPEGPDGQPAPAVGPADAWPGKKPAIPSRYSDPETTPLRVEVPRQGGALDLPLTSRP
jgi:hypothetical protein